MSALRMLSGRPELRAALIALLLMAAVAVALAGAAPAAAAVLALSAVAGVALVGAGAAARPRHAPRRTAAPTGEAGPTLRLTLPDGETVSARPVSLPGQASEQLLLTRNGYVVVDADGRVLHRL